MKDYNTCHIEIMFFSQKRKYVVVYLQTSLRYSSKFVGQSSRIFPKLYKESIYYRIVNSPMNWFSIINSQVAVFLCPLFFNDDEVFAYLPFPRDIT